MGQSPSSEKRSRQGSLFASEGGDAAVNKGGGRRASRGFNPGVGAYFTVGGPISRRQSEPARIHHRVTPRNNLLGHGDRLSKPSYLFISPRARSVTPALPPSLPPSLLPSRNTATVFFRRIVAITRSFKAERELCRIRPRVARSTDHGRLRKFISSSFLFFKFFSSHFIFHVKLGMSMT